MQQYILEHYLYFIFFTCGLLIGLIAGMAIAFWYDNKQTKKKKQFFNFLPEETLLFPKKDLSKSQLIFEKYDENIETSSFLGKLVQDLKTNFIVAHHMSGQAQVFKNEMGAQEWFLTAEYTRIRDYLKAHPDTTLFYYLGRNQLPPLSYEFSNFLENIHAEGICRDIYALVSDFIDTDKCIGIVSLYDKGVIKKYIEISLE